jgi:DNA-binding CsgD family transcriptional regulator
MPIPSAGASAYAGVAQVTPLGTFVTPETDMPLAGAISPAQLAAAADLGALAADGGAGRADGAGEQALELLDRIVPSDASVLHGVADGAFACQEVGQRHYPGPVRDALGGRFFTGPHMSKVLGVALPPSISTEDGHAFQRSSIYREVIRPAGFRDGMSAELRQHGRRVGFVHLSATTEAFDDGTRQLLAAVLPALARLVDAPARAAVRAEIPEGASAALVRGQDVVPLPGRELPPILQDPLFGEVMAALRDQHHPRLSGLWSVGSRWYRFGAELLAGSADVLVHCRDVEAPHRLTGREAEILAGLQLGLSNAEMAAAFSLSARTIHSHVESVLHKTAMPSRARAAALAHRERLGVVTPHLPDLGLATLLHPVM